MTEVNGPKEDPIPAKPLRAWERAFAILLGLLFGTGGAFAIFDSSNQAGTAVLLLASAGFFLIGVQGTSLIRFGSGSGAIELEEGAESSRR